LFLLAIAKVEVVRSQTNWLLQRKRFGRVNITAVMLIDDALSLLQVVTWNDLSWTTVVACASGQWHVLRTIGLGRFRSESKNKPKRSNFDNFVCGTKRENQDLRFLLRKDARFVNNAKRKRRSVWPGPDPCRC